MKYLKTFNESALNDLLKVKEQFIDFLNGDMKDHWLKRDILTHAMYQSFCRTYGYDINGFAHGNILDPKFSDKRPGLFNAETLSKWFKEWREYQLAGVKKYEPLSQEDAINLNPRPMTMRDLPWRDKPKVRKFKSQNENYLENKKSSFLVPHLIGNPVDAVDTFIQLSRKKIESGNYEDAIKMLDSADKSIEEAKSHIHDFRTGKYDT